MLASLIIGSSILDITTDEIEDQYRQFYLSKAKALALHVTDDINLSEAERLVTLKTLWAADSDLPADEYICIVDDSAQLLLHTAAPNSIGHNAGSNLLLGTQHDPAGTLGELVEQKQQYVGGYISSAGEEQIAAFAPIGSTGLMLGVHRSQEAVSKLISDKLRPQFWGTIIFSLIILPISLGLLFIVYLRLSRRQSKEQTQLLDQHNFLNQVIESLQYPFYVIDVKDYTVVMANSATKDYVDGEKLTCYKMTHGVDRPCHLEGETCPLEMTVASGEAAVVEHSHKGQEGEIQTVEVHSYPIFDKDNKVKSVIEYSIDVSQRKRYENELKEAAEIQKVLYQISNKMNKTDDVASLAKSIQGYLEPIVDTSNYFIAIHDPEGNKLHFPYFMDEKDESPGSVQFGNGMTEYLIKNGKPLLASHDDILKLTDEGKIQILGTPPKIWMGVPLLIDGQCVGAIVVQSYTDETLYTSDQLRILEFVSTQIAEAVESVRTRRELAKERMLVNTLMKHTIDKIYFKDEKSRFLKISDSLSELFKLEYPEQAVGKSDRDFYSAEHVKKSIQDEQRIMKTGQPLINSEEHFINSDHSERWVSTTKLPLLDDEGQIAGTFGISRDITETKLAQKSADESSNIRELLLDVITHDLKNPSGVIYSLADMAQGQFPENKLIAEIKSSSSRLLEVLQNTTILTQAATGEGIPKETLDLASHITGLAEEFSQGLSEAGIELRINAPAKLKVHANPLIVEVLRNYLSNAIKYSASGKEILLSADLDGDNLLISVEDLGFTIPEMDREKVFERLFQLDTNKKRGRGLGLSISKRIAEAHDGKVWVEPNTPTGNKFYLSIPNHDGN